jgi:hypothetical protein
MKASIPLNRRGEKVRSFNLDGLPKVDLEMEYEDPWVKDGLVMIFHMELISIGYNYQIANNMIIFRPLRVLATMEQTIGRGPQSSAE